MTVAAWTLVSLLGIAGGVPARIGQPLRATFVSESGQALCEVSAPANWVCSQVSDSEYGAVVLVGDRGVAAIAAPLSRAALVVSAWGRLVATPAGGVQIAVLKPQRSPYRTKVMRFTPVREDTAIVRITDRLQWIGGQETDPDAYVLIAMDGLATARIRVDALRSDAPENPLAVVGLPALAIDGTAITAQRDPAQNVAVELFEPLEPDAPATVPIDAQRLIRRASTTTDASGRFTFDRLANGAFLVAAADAVAGRATVSIQSVTDPVVVRLKPPARLTGRVLRATAPVAGARVRFVPSASALIESDNPHDLIAEEAVTGADGRFSLSLPPSHAGEIQVIAPGGAIVRLSLSGTGNEGDRSLGDITLAEPRRLTVRLLDGDACELTAAGPLGALGLTIVRATPAGAVHWFELPEAGEWALNAECAGVDVRVEPATVRVTSQGPDLSIEARLVKRPL